ncbi:MAG: gluconate 2-dehydrogenase subunit 3 family protein [Caulobacteraceae bacterium]
MADRYPGYDVLAKRWSQSWNPQTRAVIDARLAAPREPRFFTAAEWRTLGAICEAIMPQPADRPPVPLPAYVDHKLAEGRLDGYRFAQMPPQGEAWRRGLAALDRAAREAHGAAFHALSPDRWDALLHRMQSGLLTGEAWGAMPCEMFFAHRVVPDITHAYYAQPVAWSEIGFGGPASPRGYVRMALDRRDPWEAAEAKSGDEADARRRNRRVG